MALSTPYSLGCLAVSTVEVDPSSQVISQDVRTAGVALGMEAAKKPENIGSCLDSNAFNIHYATMDVHAFYTAF